MSNLQETELVLPHEEIKRAVEKIIKEQGFITYKSSVSAGSNVGDNYLGIMYKVTVIGQKESGKEETFKLICKLPPSNAARRKEFRVKECFDREVLMYNEVLPLFNKLQEEKGITDDKFNAVPHCFATSMEDEKEFIIMKDLRDENYAMFDRMKVLDFDHAKLIMKAIGKYHAFSFALRDQQPNVLKKYMQLSDIMVKEDDEPFKELFIDACDKAVNSLETHEIHLRKKMATIKNTFSKLLLYCVDGSQNEPYSVVCHGDCWNNNFLFKYHNGTPADVKLLDFQIARYASPVLDIVYYIFSCSEAPLRKQHYDKLLQTYHESFSEFLTQLGSDPQKLFSYETFQGQLKKYGVFGLLMAVVIIKVIIQKGEDTPDLDKLAEDMAENSSAATGFYEGFDKIKDEFNIRVSGVIRDMDRNGYLDCIED